jgi:mannose-6-phosphate isomerase
MNELYPLTFTPILKKIIWGGSEICAFKGIPAQDGIGESWEISGVDGDYSVVEEGSLKGKSIAELMCIYKEELLGKKVWERFGNTFPLLIKFIDAKDNLSIQVHPDDELAMQRHHSFGKTEMWYVINAAPGAALYNGFAEKISPDEYEKRVADGSIMTVLSRHEVKSGDTFFIPAGRVHAIGAGCFIAEIQQTSNITYRIYDYGRRDANGKERELHTELAKDAINYEIEDNYKVRYDIAEDDDCSVPLVDCKYFHTELINLRHEPLSCFLREIDSFVIYICLEGELSVTDDVGRKVVIRQGQTVLIPASVTKITLAPESPCRLLETYISDDVSLDN